MTHLGKVPTTIDELLEYPRSAELMSDEELTAFLRPYFPATRPTHQPSALEDKTKRLEASLDDEAALLAAARAIKQKKLDKLKEQNAS